MQQKKQLLKECVEILSSSKVEKWYSENLQGKSQGETINSLLDGHIKGFLTTKEALSIALLVGFQWNVKFKDVP